MLRKWPEHIDQVISLPRQGSWPEAAHQFDRDSVYALMAAEAAGRPLLVRGEPGTGKSQLARAAAVATKRLFLAVVVNSRTECHELQWHFDAVARLAEAQVAVAASNEDRKSSLEAVRFLSPGPLWWVLDWHSALEQHKRCSTPPSPAPDQPDGWKPEDGSVLLIDEIDKADTDLPNGLLETLGNGDFKPPFRGKAVRQSSGVPAPLVVITTNEERELPAAFLRRCVVLPLEIPRKDELMDFLRGRGRVHFPDRSRCSDMVLHEAARLLVQDRMDAEQGQPRPGQAEYLDLLRAVVTCTRDEPQPELRQLELLKELRRFVLGKFSGQNP